MWIDRQTFVRLKVQAVETQLSGSVVSNDETQVFAPAGEVAGPAGLAVESAVEQADLPDRRTERPD